MGLRALGLLLALALLGGGLGWAWAEAGSGPVTTPGAPEPVAADDPALPYTPPEKVRSDSDLPPLEGGVTTHEEKLGPPTSEGVVVPVPDSWDRFDLTATEARWTAPDNPPGAYSVRVEILEDERSLVQQVAQREAGLRLDDGISSLEILDTSGDTLLATFIQNGFRRLQAIRWVSFRGGNADVEIAVSGRKIDQVGMEELVARMATAVRRQAPLIPPGERPAPSEAPSTAPASPSATP